MAFVPTAGIAMATIRYQDVHGILAINRLYCGATTVPTEADLEEIGDALYDVWVAQIMNDVEDNWSLIGITVRAMNEAEGLEVEDTNSYPIAGGLTSALSAPNQLSYTVTFNTGLVGRSARGRAYGVGLGNGYHDGVRLTDGSRAILQSEWELVLTALESAGHALNVVSFQEGGVLRTAGRPLPVTDVNVRFPLATQRRRLT